MIGSVGQPLLFLLALGFGFGPVYARAGGGNYLQFLAPGVIAMSILFTAMFGGIEIIWDRQFGFLKETMVAPVSRFEIMLGRAFGGATVAVAQGIFVFLISMLVGFRPHGALVPLALLFMMLIALLFTALGTAIGSMLEDMQAFPLIMNFLVMPIFFLSGALFPLAGAPRGIAIIATLNPLSYGVHGLRATLLEGVSSGLGIDFVVLVGVSALFLGIGSYVFSKAQV